MGIVVSLAMLLGIIFLLFERFYTCSKPSLLMKVSLLFMLAAGLWNSVWYGLQNLATFWGLAGFVSGIFILMSTLLVYKKGLSESAMPQAIQKLLRVTTIVGLVLCFALYVITIVRINLALPIIS